MKKVKLTDIFNQDLGLTMDRMGCWTLTDTDGRELFIQSESDKESWTGRLIIRNHQWYPLGIYLKRHDLDGWTHDVRISSDDWGMAIGTL